MVTIEIIDAAALRLLRDLAGLRLIRFAEEASEADRVTALLNEIYAHEDSSLDPSLTLAQAEACPFQGLGGEDW